VTADARLTVRCFPVFYFTRCDPGLFRDTGAAGSPTTSHQSPSAVPGARVGVIGVISDAALKEQEMMFLFLIARLGSSSLLRLALEQVEEAS
jgi:hypothetical protein